MSSVTYWWADYPCDMKAGAVLQLKPRRGGLGLLLIRAWLTLLHKTVLRVCVCVLANRVDSREPCQKAWCIYTIMWWCHSLACCHPLRMFVEMFSCWIRALASCRSAASSSCGSDTDTWHTDMSSMSICKHNGNLSREMAAVQVSLL